MTDPTDYDNADFIPGGHAFWGRWQAASAAFRAAHPPARPALRYGDHPREAADLHLPEGTPRGLLVFLHGGFWRMGDRGLWAYLAAGPLAQGWAVAMPSYPLAPEARIGAITRAVARALPVLAAEVAGPILLVGHSAGGHLALRLVCPDADLPRAVADRVAAVLAISPLADLAPLIGMPMNADLRLDPAEARAESPISHAPPDLPVFLRVGAEERPAFRDQARRLAAAWPDAHLCVAPDRHHFDVIDALAEPDSPTLRRLLAAAGRARG